VQAAKGDPALGEALFRGRCSGCHGQDAEGTIVAPSLSNDEFLYLADARFLYQTITHGRPDNGMPAHPEFDAEQLASLIAWIRRDPPSPQKIEQMRRTFESVTGVSDPASYRAAGSATYGKLLYEGLCQGCHAAEGRGAIGPGIGSPAFQGVASDGFIAATIALGRGGRAMRPFGALGLSQLSDREVGDLIAYLRSVAASPDRPRGPRLHGDIGHGRELWGSYCVGCHGVEGRGASGPALNNQGFLSAATDGFLLATIARGRMGTPMHGWLAGGNNLETLTPEDVLDLVAYVRSFESH
jgi:mono/diheme cytochrome c family protein